MAINRLILLVTLAYLTIFGNCKDVFGEWMAIKGCHIIEEQGNDTISLHDNKPETCLGSCTENTTSIAMQGHQCLCQESPIYQPTNEDNCIVCSADEGNCIVTNRAVWLVYEKVSALQLEYFGLSKVEQNESTCLVVKTTPGISLAFEPINCNHSQRYLCYNPSRALPASCKIVQDQVRWSSSLTALCHENGFSKSQPVETKEQIQKCVEETKLNTKAAAGICFWLGIAYIKREAALKTTLFTSTSTPAVSKFSPRTTTFIASTTPLNSSSVTPELNVLSTSSSKISSKLANGTTLKTTAPTLSFSSSSLQKYMSTSSILLAMIRSSTYHVEPMTTHIIPTSYHPTQILRVNNRPIETKATGANSNKVAGMDSNTVLIIALAVIGGVLLVIVVAAVWCFARQNRTFLKALTNQQRNFGQGSEFCQMPGPRSVIMTDNGGYVDSDDLRGINETMFNNAARFPAYSAPPSVIHGSNTLRETNAPIYPRTNSEIHAPSRASRVNVNPRGNSNNFYSSFPSYTRGVLSDYQVTSNPSFQDDVETQSLPHEHTLSEPNYAVVDRGTLS